MTEKKTGRGTNRPKRTGPYRRKTAAEKKAKKATKKTPAKKEKEEDTSITDQVEAAAQKYYKDSSPAEKDADKEKDKSRAARLDACRSLARVTIIWDRMIVMYGNENLASDEVKVLHSISREARALREAIGFNVVPVDDDDED